MHYKFKKLIATLLAVSSIVYATPLAAGAAQNKAADTKTVQTADTKASSGSAIAISGSSVTATTGSSIKPNNGKKNKPDKTKPNKTKPNKNKPKTNKTKKNKSGSGDAKKIKVVDSILSAKPVVTTVRLTISHKKQKNRKITGYVIYKKNKAGKWVRRAVVKKTGKFTYIDSKTTTSRKNIYCVRAYYKKGKKVYYGKCSKSVSVSVKVRAVERKVTDKNSPVYGKTLVMFYYADGSKVKDPTRYVNENKFKTYALYVNKARQYVTAYGVRNGKYYPLRAFICSPGNATPVGTHKIILKYRWHELMGPCWGQWCSKIVSNGIYFHSIFSSRPNSNSTISVNAYNKLGTTCSHGCVRLQAYAAKWIYDHCRVGTTVVITNKKGYEPFSKPVIGKLASWHTWDPTDPTAQKYCQKHKCHKYAKKK